ncbi:MAG TPA: glycoside hydrolase family 19 protein, partial [Polyangia bacterium]|nr:glycoside hydrolase family 19 protein [Polyangia bacterium]
MGRRQAGPLGASLEHHDHATALRRLVHQLHRLPGGRSEWQHDKSIRRRLELYPLSGGLTVTLLRQALPRVRVTAVETWVGPLNAACGRYEITRSARRMAAFLGHIAHESSYLHAVEENMRYKDADRLAKVFPSAFKTRVDAEPYVDKPEALANKVYANRMGNGDTASGEGWKYRGRGLIQLTGRDNYAALAKDANVAVVQNPDLVATPQYAALSAAWFWKKHGLNELADIEAYQA